MFQNLFNAISWSGTNIRSTRPLSHELCKKCLEFYSSYSPIHHKTLSTSECSYDYGPCIEMEIVSVFSSCHQLGLVQTSD